MSSARCPLCDKAGLQNKNTAVSVSLDDGRQHRLPPAKHEYCPHCDEHFYAPGALPVGRTILARTKKGVKRNDKPVTARHK